MQELFSRLIAALNARGPKDPEVANLIARIEAEGPKEAIAQAQALRSGWLRSQGLPLDPAGGPAADAAMARIAERPQFDKELHALNAYTDGKMKRYGLLFAVNGGAFAVAKLLADRTGTTAQSPVLGGLQLWHLAAGAAAFTAVMCFDIGMFGAMMRRNYFPRGFGWPGRVVLAAMGGLLVAGWGLAAFGPAPTP